MQVQCKRTALTGLEQLEPRILLSAAGPRAAGAEPADTPPLALKDVSCWAYQLQALNEPGAVDALAASPYDLLVLEPTRTDWDFDDKTFDTAAMVAQVKDSLASDGAHRKLVCAYIDIGQAEDWRWYWTWSREGSGGSHRPLPADWPGFIVGRDPDGWAGCYPVAYWDADWKDIVIYGEHTGSDPDRDYVSVVDEAIKDGFDGIYLDWVAGYEDSNVMAAAAAAGKDPQQEMIDFIGEMRAYAQARDPGFVVVQQNGSELLVGHPETADVVDGIAQESVWYEGEAAGSWSDRHGYDIRVDRDLTATLQANLGAYQAAGLVVFNCDYAVKHAAQAYANSYAAGYVPYVSRTPLSRLTTTPPPWVGNLSASPDTVTSGETLTLTWTDSDPDDDAQVTLGWDVDSHRDNNTPDTQGIDWDVIAAGISENDPADSHEWTVDVPAVGPYRLWADITDGQDSARNYADHPLKVVKMVNGMALVGRHDYGGGLIVSVYDADPDDGVTVPNVAWSSDKRERGTTDICVVAGSDAVVRKVNLLDGAGGLDDVGIVVEGNSLLRTLSDGRRASPCPLVFVASQGAVKSMTLRAGLTGAELDGFVTEGGLTLLVDDDGGPTTLTAVCVHSALGSLQVQGDVSGDVMVHGTIGSAAVKRGSFQGEVIATQGIRKVTAKGARSDLGMIGGNIGGVRSEGGSIGSVTATGDVTGRIASAGALGKLAARGCVGADVTWGEGLARISVSAAMEDSQLSGAGGSAGIALLQVSGDVLRCQVDVGGVLRKVAVKGALTNSTIQANELGLITVGGLIAEDPTDGDQDTISAEIEHFSVKDLDHPKVRVTFDTPQSFGNVSIRVNQPPGGA